MTGGKSPIGYLKAYMTNLYLSKDSEKVTEAIEEGKWYCCWVITLISITFLILLSAASRCIWYLHTCMVTCVWLIHTVKGNLDPTLCRKKELVEDGVWFMAPCRLNTHKTNRYETLTFKCDVCLTENVRLSSKIAKHLPVLASQFWGFTAFICTVCIYVFACWLFKTRYF